MKRITAADKINHDRYSSNVNFTSSRSYPFCILNCPRLNCLALIIYKCPLCHIWKSFSPTLCFVFHQLHESTSIQFLLFVSLCSLHLLLQNIFTFSSVEDLSLVNDLRIKEKEIDVDTITLALCSVLSHSFAFMYD